MDYECAICGIKLHSENPKIYFCSRCYRDWKREIQAKESWVTCLINFESRRRRWDTYKENGETKYVELVRGLGTDFDVLNGKVILINRERNK